MAKPSPKIDQKWQNRHRKLTKNGKNDTRKMKKAAENQPKMKKAAQNLARK
jgi:hypothetical protein